MDDLIELGDIGIKIDIPKELMELSALNDKLFIENRHLKKTLYTLLFVLGGIGIYWLWSSSKRQDSENQSDLYVNG